MRSHINSTGRKKIDSRMATFAVTTHANGVVDFEADIDLSPLDLPEDAEIFVEAYRQTIHERFPFGTVANPAPSQPTRLHELDAHKLTFRIKVVERQTGCVLARGDKFGTSEIDEIGRSALLKVVVRDIGHEPWKTEIHQEGRPVLVLNANIPDVRNKIRTDPLFKALILPGALRQILMRLWLEQTEDEPDDEGLWTNQWLRYAESISSEDKPDWEEMAQVEDWIDRVTNSFCTKFGILNMIPQED